MAIRRARAAWSIALVAALGASEARADDGPDSSAKLRLVSAAPRECHEAAGMRDRILSLVRTPPATWKSAVEVRVTIARAPRGFVGRLGVVQLDAPEHAPAERELRGSTCRSVVEALAVSAALAVDDALEEAAAATTTDDLEEPSPEDGGPEASLPTRRPPRRARRTTTRPARAPRRPLELRVGNVIGLRQGIVREPLWIQTAFLSAARRNSYWPALRAELTFGASDVARTAVGAYRARVFEGAAAACSPRRDGWLDLVGLCAGVSGGALVTTSFEVIRSADRGRPWFAAFASARASFPVVSGLSVVADARVAIPFFRERLSFYPGITVYEAPAFVLQGALGLEVTLPGALR
ncbi:MAG: hypothetical protein KF850_17690 [Labilithrix sp.]|nr:hypothetical protein [Labilithrix sp.]